MRYLTMILLSLLFSCNGKAQEPKTEKKMDYNVTKTDEEWKESLTTEQYWVLRQKGTERPHTGQYYLHFEDGTYSCAGCGQKLFESASKFDSHCGWPSFDAALKGAIEYKVDKSHGMIRTEILCTNCGGHIGHVFDDGPTETGKRYCVNSISIDFEGKQD